MAEAPAASRFAWALGVTSMVLLAISTWLAFVNGSISPSQAVFLTEFICAIVGAAIVSAHPGHTVGWLLCWIAFAAGVSAIVWDYGFSSSIGRPATLPGGLQILWVGTWSWIVPIGIGVPLLTLRVPDGRLLSRFRPIEWVAIAGTAFLALGLAVTPGRMVAGSSAQNPFGLADATAAVTGLRTAGAALLLVAAVGSAVALVIRMRASSGEEGEQLKWIASAGALMTLTLAYGLIAAFVFHADLYNSLTPFFVATLALPVAIGVAIFKYRLYDIDIIINRALVYGGLTAILAGLYTAGIGLSQRLFVAMTGEKSDAAVLLTAFIVAAAFTPIKSRLQAAVDRRFDAHPPSVALKNFHDQVEMVLNVIDSHKIACRLVDEAVVLFGATTGALYVTSTGSAPFYMQGDWRGEAALQVPLQLDGVDMGSLALGRRRGRRPYSPADRLALKQCADVVAEALDRAADPSSWSTARPH